MRSYMLFLMFVLVFTCEIRGKEIETIRNSVLFENDWKSAVELADDGSLRLSWKPTEQSIVLRVEARTHGYVGMGFSLDGRMAKADIAVGWVDDKTKEAHLLDCHGDVENSAPKEDVVQNIKLLEAHQNDTHTVLIYARLWDTCDENEDIIIGNDTIRVIWAVNTKDPIDDTKSMSWHGKIHRGSKSLNLKNPSVKRAEKSAKFLDFKIPNVTITPNMATIYWCKVFKISPLPTKHHIVGYTPILEAKNADLIHHMLLYECHVKQSPKMDKMDQYASENGFLCYTSKMPVETESCITPIVTWAIGSEGEFFPPHVGLPLGENTKQNTYYMLEVHYDNPSLRGVKDNSGIRLHYTDKVRKHDGGIFVSGTIVSPLHIIPPFQLSYKTAGYCDKSCTNAVFPLAGVNSVSVVLHSHSAAYKMRLRHFRQGEELSPIVQDEHYDFNYQQSRALPREVTIFPGDELVTECTYNTANRSEPTQGGYSTKQEMCLAYITYYPRVQLASCQSMNPIPFFFFTFGIKKFYYYDMDTIEKVFLKMTDKVIKRHSKKSSAITPKLPVLTPGKESDQKFNEAYISMLKQMPDYTIDEPEEANLFQELVISEPLEFQNKTFSQHLLDLPWKEIYQKVEDMFYYGKHMTFCRLQNDSLALTTNNVHLFPNITLYQVPKEDNPLLCKSTIRNTNLVNRSMKLTKNITLIFILLVTYFKVLNF